MLLLWLRGGASGNVGRVRLQTWRLKMRENKRRAQRTSAASPPERTEPSGSVHGAPAILSGCHTGVTRGSKQTHLWAAAPMWCKKRRGVKMVASWANRSFSVWQDSYYFIAARQQWWIMNSIIRWHHPCLNISAIHHASVRRLTFKLWLHQGQATRILLANITGPP